MSKKKCCLCGSQNKLTAEHKIKSSLLTYFNKLQNNTPNKELLFYDGTDNGGTFTNIKNAKNLKPRKNICECCNSNRSTDCDLHFDKFIKGLYNLQDNIDDINSLVLPSIEEAQKEANHQKSLLKKPIDSSLWMEATLVIYALYRLTPKYQLYRHQDDDRLIKKYLAKHSICYFERMGIEYPISIRSLFLNGTDDDSLAYEIFYLPKSFQYGYMNTAVKFPSNGLNYALIFSNLALHVSITHSS